MHGKAVLYRSSQNTKDVQRQGEKGNKEHRYFRAHTQNKSRKIQSVLTLRTDS